MCDYKTETYTTDGANSFFQLSLLPTLLKYQKAKVNTKALRCLCSKQRYLKHCLVTVKARCAKCTANFKDIFLADIDKSVIIATIINTSN